MSKTHLVLSWWCEDESVAGQEDVESGALGALTSIRNELMSGDYRALYLSWMLRRQAGEFRRIEKEPARPPNMKRMAGSQRALAEFPRLELSSS